MALGNEPRWTTSVGNLRSQVHTLEELADVIDSEAKLKKLAERVGNDNAVAKLHRQVEKDCGKFKDELLHAARERTTVRSRPPSPDIIVLSDSDDENRARPAKRARNNASAHPPAKIEPCEPLPRFSPISSVSDNSDDDSDFQERDVRRPGNSRGARQSRFEGGASKRLPELSQAELEALFAWKTENNTKRYSWKEAWASVPSLRRMTFDVCERAFNSQKRVFRKQGGIWPYE